MRQAIINMILSERGRQDSKFGVQNLTPEVWLVVLVEKLGAVAQEVLNMRRVNPDYTNYRTELIQVAAVAVAAIECLDREHVKEETL